MNIRCPHCQTVFRVDPARVPAAGIRARCSRCGDSFSVPLPRDAVAAHVRQPAANQSAEPSAPPPAGQPTRAAPAAPSYGAPTPDARAQRMARALVSDIVAYHGPRRDHSLRAGTLRADFREEILKSWEEYTQQVGQELAQATPYFRDALNEILARGEKVF